MNITTFLFGILIIIPFILILTLGTYFFGKFIFQFSDKMADSNLLAKHYIAIPTTLIISTAVVFPYIVEWILHLKTFGLLIATVVGVLFLIIQLVLGLFMINRLFKSK